MSEQSVPGTLVATSDAAAAAAEASARVATEIAAALGQGRRASIALSGGNTPRDAYARLAHASGIDWSRVDVFWVDERAVAPTDDRSNYRWAKATLLDGAPVPDSSVHRMAAERTDLATAAGEYERELRRHVAPDAGGIPAIDVVVLGVGDDGHTASLFPGDPNVDVTDRLVVAVVAAEGREARMTLTTPVLQHARHLFVLAVGAGKRPALSRAWSVDGDLRATPARLLRAARGNVVWICDRAAAGAPLKA
jgi:6-phosphogluconolactonase